METELQSIEQIKSAIQTHAGFKELKIFGQNLEKITLSQENIKIFFATMWAFFSETPSGILSLSLRVHDFWSQMNPWEAMAKSACVLSTAVDEFGLDNINQNQISATHHQLFKITTSHFGVSSDDLLDEKNILSAGTDIKKISFDYYRNQNIMLTLGFHLASELTSWYEFNCFLKGFISNKTYYGINSDKDESMKFFLIHTIVEPAHLLSSEKIIKYFLNQNPYVLDKILEGAVTYMNFYFKLFNQLNKNLF